MTDNDIALLWQDTWQQAQAVAHENPLLYRVEEQREAADQALAEDIAYWKTIYPDVKLQAEDNPGVDFRLLTQPWQAAWGNPPLVFLRVTPRKKQLPKTSSWLQTLGSVAPILSIIPVVGAVLAIAVSVASAADQQSRIKRFIAAATSITATAFEPQYYPDTFPVLLPLDEAQVAVEQPWLLPRLHRQFTNRIKEAQRRFNQEIAGQPSRLTLAPNLAGEVVAVQAPDEEVKQSWVEQLLVGAGRPISPSAEYLKLQTAHGTQLPTYGNLNAPETAGFFNQTPQAPTTAGGQLATASVGGSAWIWLAAGALAWVILRKG